MVCRAAAVLSALIVAAGCREAPLADLTRLTDARARAADALVQFVKTVDAGNRAVMADTDEASAAFAREAEEAASAVSRDVETLAPLLRDLGYPEETRLLDDLTRAFNEFRMLDRGVLDLAVENTNLKAQRLSFGPAFEAADMFRDNLEALVPGGGTTDMLRARALVATAIAAVREIQALQAPHIAESSDEGMVRLEKRASAAEVVAADAMATLRGLTRPAAQRQLAAAAAALDRFLSVNRDIVALSRRNSNVRSLALSLGQKRMLAASCEDSMRALQEALSKRNFAGTR
jgi:hypothetical protein